MYLGPFFYPPTGRTIGMSVFTFDADPPRRVASPWLRPADPGRIPTIERPSKLGASYDGQPGSLSDYGVTKLEAEPQDGPTEYKLHLLLRPRRKFEYMSTAQHVSGSVQSRPSPSPDKPARPMPSTTPLDQTRQDRLTHLTTQLLWRLQQSCPYHAGSATLDLVIPQLPDVGAALGGQLRVSKLLPGLEASRGALYEIGVADDGTLVGLTQDEMDESLATLRVMAASLGCIVEVLRTVIVGECEWIGADEQAAGEPQQGKLWVAEALVTPDLTRDATQESWGPGSRASPRPADATRALPDPKLGPLTSDQLRITLTGPTTSGKSTMLGTLSTGTLDNGHGKSRLNLLKHRHELVSGVTSSVAQELIGYNDGHILNYAHDGIESWLDIHDYTKDGRLVYLVDSAGHPRYRRTILRGIVGWAPHWTLLCLAADDSESAQGVGTTASAADILGAAGAGVDLAGAHLDLCLHLDSPLAIVITKLDLASRASLQRILGKVLTAIKKTRRLPKILRPAQNGTPGCGGVTTTDDNAVKSALADVESSGGLNSVVPIVLTSAVKGDGIGLLHALLQQLPLPPEPTSHDLIGAALNPEQPACLFHIEDKFSLAASYSLATTNADQETDLGTVVAGYLRFGDLSVGDRVLIGPFPPEDDEARGTPEDRPSPGSGLSISHPSSAELTRIAIKNAISASAIKGEWHTVRIVSIRNLRLPVQTLKAGQVGSIGVVFELPKQNETDSVFEAAAPAMPRIRKGMVLAMPSQHMLDTGLSLQAASGLTATFEHPDAGSVVIGSLVNIYVASVRAAARVLHVSRAKMTAEGDSGSGTATEDIVDVFNLNEQIDEEDAPPGLEMPCGVEVQLELLTTREWIELGSQILILEGGSKDKSGLEGFVGRVVEIVD
ncbi:hypothetical protein GQ53DRAFT_806977 [Thozetella sp. PMI_491]|nr:hypothetical protein GQ53DRAFT_806977 [Thozetella sp. PMI_491]